MEPSLSNGPLRPARSVRRPQQAPALDISSSSPSRGDRVASSPTGGLAPAIPLPRSSNIQQPSTHSRTTSNLNPNASPSRPGPSGTSRSALMVHQTRNMPDSSSTYENELDMAISPIDGPSNQSGIPPWSNQYSEPSRQRERESTTPTSPSQGGLGSLTQPKEPAALNSVISALSAAGRKHQANRIMRGGVDVTAEEEKKRRKNERKIDDLRGKSSRPLKEISQDGVVRD